MDEIWERAVETAMEGQTDRAAARSLTLDGAVKCVSGRLPPPGLLERFESLQHLSIANIGVSSLEQFPRLRSLEKLILSDNRIAGGLEFLVEAGLDSLRDLDLSNNRIQFIEDLAPLAQLNLVSLDLYECPVTRVKDYRSRVFGLIKSLRYLDKMDAEENERPESDEEDEDEEEEEDDPGSGEIDGGEENHRQFGMSNGHCEGVDGVVDVDEDEESDADEEETETARRVENGGTGNHRANGFRVAAATEVEVDDEDDEENDSGEDEIDEDDDVVEVHDIGDSDEEDGIEYDEEDEDDDEDEDDEDDEEEVDNDEAEVAEPESTGRVTSTEGEIDGHEQGEDEGDEDDNVESGEDEDEEVVVVEEDGAFDEYGDEEEDDYGAGYLVQPVPPVTEEDAGAVDTDPVNEECNLEEEEEDVEDDEEVQEPPPSSSSHLKRKRDDEDDDDVVEPKPEPGKSSKKHH